MVLENVLATMVACPPTLHRCGYIHTHGGYCTGALHRHYVNHISMRNNNAETDIQDIFGAEGTVWSLSEASRGAETSAETAKASRPEP